MFKLQFSTDNAAFEGADRGSEIARILRKLADTITDWRHTADNFDGLPIMDVNGNKIGSVSDAVDLP